MQTLDLRVGALVVLACSVAAPSACTANDDRSTNGICRPLQFRACETGVGRGVQHCADAGLWSDCELTVTDARFDVSLDARADAPDAGTADSSEASADSSADSGNPEASEASVDGGDSATGGDPG